MAHEVIWRSFPQEDGVRINVHPVLGTLEGPSRSKLKMLVAAIYGLLSGVRSAPFAPPLLLSR